MRSASHSVGRLLLIASTITSTIAFGLLTTACSAEGSGPASGESPSGTLTVFATASVSNAFTELVRVFDEQHPELEVVMNVAASSTLATQIIGGASADVFASSDLFNMERVSAAGEINGEPAIFATNTAAIIVERGNPLDITSLDELTDPQLIVIACVPEAPCGRYTNQILERASLEIEFKSLEENVRAVSNKVILGEADAGIVFATDVLAAGTSAAGVDIPPEFNIVADYVIAMLNRTTNPTAARAFIDFVTSEPAQTILASYGFTSP